MAAVVDGHANRVIYRVIFSVFLEFIGKLAVVIQWLAECFQLPALAGVQVVAVDDEFQVPARGYEGIAEPEYLVVKAGVLTIVEHMKFRRWQVNQLALVDSFVEGLQVQLEQFICVAEKADRHIIVDGALMFYQHEVDAVQGAGYIVFQAAENAAVQRVDFQEIQVCVAGALYGVDQGQQPRIGRAVAVASVEIMAEHGIPYRFVFHRASSFIIAKNQANR